MTTKFDERVYDKEDVIHALKSLETYFNGDAIELQHFKYQAGIIEEAFDYLMSRLQRSESERFGYDN